MAPLLHQSQTLRPLPPPFPLPHQNLGPNHSCRLWPVLLSQLSLLTQMAWGSTSPSLMAAWSLLHSVGGSSSSWRLSSHLGPSLLSEAAELLLVPESRILRSGGVHTARGVGRGSPWRQECVQERFPLSLATICFFPFFSILNKCCFGNKKTNICEEEEKEGDTCSVRVHLPCETHLPDKAILVSTSAP